MKTEMINTKAWVGIKFVPPERYPKFLTTTPCHAKSTLHSINSMKNYLTLFPSNS